MQMGKSIETFKYGKLSKILTVNKKCGYVNMV